MKRKTTTILLLLISGISARAQDIITMKNGDDIKAKNIEVTPMEVKYKKYESQQGGATYTINKSDILMIRYEDGTKDMFNNELPKQNTAMAEQPHVNAFSSTPNYSSFDMKEQGIKDAKKYYRHYRAGEFGTFIATAVGSPLLGLIPAIATSHKHPKDISLKYPNPELMKDPVYNKAYKDKAYQMKKHKVWHGYLYGAIISVGLTIIIATAVAS